MWADSPLFLSSPAVYLKPAPLPTLSALLQADAFFPVQPQVDLSYLHILPAYALQTVYPAQTQKSQITEFSLVVRTRFPPECHSGSLHPLNLYFFLILTPSPISVPIRHANFHFLFQDLLENGSVWLKALTSQSHYLRTPRRDALETDHGIS